MREIDSDSHGSNAYSTQFDWFELNVVVLLLLLNAIEHCASAQNRNSNYTEQIGQSGFEIQAEIQRSINLKNDIYASLTMPK